MTCFFDTNVLIYAVDARDSRKQERALALYAETLEDQSFAISTQVLAEFYNIVTRGVAPLLRRAEARVQVAALARQRVVATTPKLVVGAIDHVERHRLQWWDALVLEAALSIGAATLYSEDFQHRQRFGELTVINPFVPDGA